jgi:hypothetical protein
MLEKRGEWLYQIKQQWFLLFCFTFYSIYGKNRTLYSLCVVINLEQIAHSYSLDCLEKWRGGSAVVEKDKESCKFLGEGLLSS